MTAASSSAAAALKPTTLVSLTASKVLGLVSPSLVPLLVPALITSYGLSPTGAGLMVSYQMICLAASGFLVSLIVHRIDRRMTALAAVGIIALGNLICIVDHAEAALIAGRMIVGGGEGALTAVTIAAAASAKVPERIFGIFAVAVGLTSAVILFALPKLIALYGAGGVFGANIALALIVLPSLIWFPARGDAGKSAEKRGSLFTLGAPAAITLGAATLFSVGLGATTSYIGVVAPQIGLTTDDVGKALSAGSLLSILAPAIVVAIGARVGLFWPMAVAATFLTALVEAIGLSPFPALFLLAAMLYNPTVLFLSPLQYGLMARLDPKGRIGAAGPTFIKIGFAIGAPAGGMVLEHAGRASLGALAGLWVAIGMVCYCWMAADADRARRQVAVGAAEAA